METDIFENTTSAVTVTVPVVDGRSRYASTSYLSAAPLCANCSIARGNGNACVFVASLTVSVPAEVFKMNPLNIPPPSCRQLNHHAGVRAHAAAAVVLQFPVGHIACVSSLLRARLERCILPDRTSAASAGERPTCARKRRIKRRAARISIAAYLRARALGGSRWPLDDVQRSEFGPGKTSMRASGLLTLDVRARVGRSGVNPGARFGSPRDSTP